MDSRKSMGPVVEYFAEMEYSSWCNRRHYLRDMIVIATCAAVAGANGWKAVAKFGKLIEAWLRGTHCLDLPHGIPSADTFRRVFEVLDAVHFQTCFVNRIPAVEQVTSGQHVAMDGKTLCRSHHRSLGK